MRIYRASCSTIRFAFISCLGIFFSANNPLVRLWRTRLTHPNLPYPNFLSMMKSSTWMALLDDRMEVFFFNEEIVDKLPIVGGSSSFFSLDFAFYISGDELNLVYGLNLSILGVK